METEVWKDVVDYEGHYLVSNWGRVKSLARLNTIGTKLRERILKYGIHPHGYANVSLSKNKKNSSYFIHVLVARAFIGERPVGYDINHKDTNKLNNRADNLEYVTHKENMEHAVENGLYHPPIGEKHPSAKLTKEKVLAIRAAHTNGALQKTLAKQYNVTPTSIYAVVHYHSWKHI